MEWPLQTLWFRALVSVVLAGFAVPTHYVSLLLLPLVLGWLGNRPMTSIVVWTALSITGVGWFIAMMMALRTTRVRTLRRA